MVQGLRDCQVDAIIDVKLGDSDKDTHKYGPMTSLLNKWEKIKKYKHSKHCKNKLIFFPPFVISVYVILGREALVVLSQLSRIMAEEREEPPS